MTMTQKSKHRNLKKSGVAARLSAFAAGLFLLIPAHACPPGTVAQKGTGWQGCAPTPGTPQSTSSGNSAAPRWIDRWGAIAVDRVTGGVGVGAVIGMINKREAQKKALHVCSQKGGTKCEIEIAYVNQCSAIIWGDRALNSSTAATKSEAERRGMEKCTRAGDTNCEIYYSACSPPERAY